MAKFSSRKLFLACACLSLLTAALFFSKITGDNFIAGVVATLGFYNAANVWQKFKVSEGESK